MKQIDPTEAVRQAKSAVESLEEPYKMEAFKLILDRLMTQQKQITDESPSTQRPKRHSSAQSKRKSSTIAKSVEKPTSTLTLSVDQLRKLHTFFMRFEVKGGELCAFVIANFLREELKRPLINAADVEYCYRQLISMKVPVPEIKDVERALNWLTAPSRKKQWLRRLDDGFEVTSSGLIALNKLEKSVKVQN